MFKMKLLRVSRGKNRKLLPAGPFFILLLVNVYRSRVIPRKLPCPKKFLVARLTLHDHAVTSLLGITKEVLYLRWKKRHLKAYSERLRTQLQS